MLHSLCIVQNTNDNVVTTLNTFKKKKLILHDKNSDKLLRHHSKFIQGIILNFDFNLNMQRLLSNYRNLVQIAKMRNMLRKLIKFEDGFQKRTIKSAFYLHIVKSMSFLVAKQQNSSQNGDHCEWNFNILIRSFKANSLSNVQALIHFQTVKFRRMNLKGLHLQMPFNVKFNMVIAVEPCFINSLLKILLWIVERQHMIRLKRSLNVLFGNDLLSIKLWRVLNGFCHMATIRVHSQLKI